CRRALSAAAAAAVAPRLSTPTVIVARSGTIRASARTDVSISDWGAAAGGGDDCADNACPTTIALGSASAAKTVRTLTEQLPRVGGDRFARKGRAAIFSNESLLNTRCTASDGPAVQRVSPPSEPAGAAFRFRARDSASLLDSHPECATLAPTSPVEWRRASVATRTRATENRRRACRPAMRILPCA